MKLPRCPVCEQPVDPTKTDAFPFCNARCRTIDMGRWLDERYTVPEHKIPDEDEDPGPAGGGMIGRDAWPEGRGGGYGGDHGGSDGGSDGGGGD